MTDYRETLSLLEKSTDTTWFLMEDNDFYYICNSMGKIKYDKISERIVDVVFD